ncbi:hypothetical protein [Streptomyces sp. NPDC057910]|uniref:hypothetical protein n=1 Tax=Streptomyces sp. NPDC057910 TaxID=3346278 RepID=UPI0036E0297B
MPSWIAALEAREDGARLRAEGLREQTGGLSEALAQVECELSRLQITRETMNEVLSAPAASSAEVPEVFEPLVPAPVPVAGLMQAAALLVAAEAGGDQAVTSPAYRQIAAVFAEQTGAKRCKDVLAAIGVPEATASQRESMRSKLKRLVERGVLVEAEPGLFTLAEAGVR